jgi:endonuclease/exonuclease/phosphatase family metal-dependent hydrolase
MGLDVAALQELEPHVSHHAKTHHPDKRQAHATHVLQHTEAHAVLAIAQDGVGVADYVDD